MSLKLEINGSGNMTIKRVGLIGVGLMGHGIGKNIPLRRTRAGASP